MKICIIHFASNLLRIFLAKFVFQEYLYEVLFVLSRCYFHHLVENSILYQKDIPHFCIGPILSSEKWNHTGSGQQKSWRSNFIWCQEWETENCIWCQGLETEKFIWCQMTVTKKLFGSQRVKTWYVFVISKYYLFLDQFLTYI